MRLNSMFLLNESCTHAIFSVSAPSPPWNKAEICYWGIFKCSFKRFYIVMQCLLVSFDNDPAGTGAVQCVLRWIAGLLTYIVSSSYWQCKQIALHSIAANQTRPLGQGWGIPRMLTVLCFPRLFSVRAKPGPRGVIVWFFYSLSDLIWLQPPPPTPSRWNTPNRMMLCRIPLDLKGYAWHYIKPSEESSSVKIDDLSNCPHRFQYWTLYFISYLDIRQRAVFHTCVVERNEKQCLMGNS